MLLSRVILLALATACCNADLLQTKFTVDKTSVEAGEAVTFRIQTRFTPGYPAELDGDKVNINFDGLDGMNYDSNQVSSYIICNLQESAIGRSTGFVIYVTEFTTSKDLDCNVTMRVSSSLSPGSSFETSMWMNWDQTRAEEGASSVSKLYEDTKVLYVERIKMSMQLNTGLETFYTCGPSYLGVDIILDFPKSDLSELEVELRWPLGSTNPDTDIIAIFTNTDDIGDVVEASGVNSGALSATQETGDLTGGIFSLTNIEATGQSEESYEDIIIRTHLEVTDEFNPLPLGSVITISATLTHPAMEGSTAIDLTYTSSLTFTILGPQVDQRWECDQYVNGGKTVYCYIWVANRYNATNPAKNVKLYVTDTDSQVEMKTDEIEFSDEYSVFGVDNIPTEHPDSYIGNTATGLTILSSLSINHQVLIKIPIVIGTADVGPIDAAVIKITYENDYSADPCNKDLGETQLDFVMMIPTFPMEEDELEEYYPRNIVIGENITVQFPMQIPQGNVDMKVILTALAQGTVNTTYDRHTRDVADQTYYKALEILEVGLVSEYDYTVEHRVETDSGFGFTFPLFTNDIHDAVTNKDVVYFNVSLRMNDKDFLDAGDIIYLTWSFDVNEYEYEKVFNVVVGEPDIGFQFQTYQDGGRIYWTVNAIQQPGLSRSNAYDVTYVVLFNEDIPVVEDSYSEGSFLKTMVDGDVIDRYLWYRDDLNYSDTFQFSFVTYLEESSSVGVRALYRALPDSYENSRTYNTTYYYPVALHQTYNARNLRLVLAAVACFFIGVLCAMLVMLVCCKRTTVLPLPTKFELYSRRPAIRLESWIRDRGDMLLTAELADDLVQALTEKDYKSSLVHLDRLDIAHTVEVEEELARQQRQVILESVGWLVTVSDLQEEGKGLFRQLDKDYQTESVELTERYMVAERELELELQKSAKVAQEQLIDDQDAELDGLVTVLQMVPFQERVDYIELMKKQHDHQRSDYEVVLRFQLEEAREQLRRDYTIRRRVALNLLIREFFNSLAEKANLSEEVREDLVSRSRHYIEVIDEAFHEEACRQKFVLEERLLKREAILRVKEERTKYHTNLMANVSNSMKQTINRLIRESLIKRSYGEDLLSQINIASNENLSAMVAVMKNYEDSVRDTVRNKAQDKAKKQLNSHLEAYEMFQQKFNAKISRKEISPAEFLERKIRFHIGRRMEEEQLVDEMDDLISQELAMIWEHYTSESLTRFRETQDRIFETLIKKAIIGSSQTEVQRQRNFRDQSKLETEKNNAIKQIEDALKQRISESEERINSQIEAEKVEESALKEQEARMVERLLENQLVMDQETRERVMREHKRNLLELEEGLTVQKLRYKKKKMTLQVEKTKHRLAKMDSCQEKERELFKAGDGRTDETIQTLLLRHQDDRTGLIKTEQTLTINEVEEIHDAILEEKAVVLADQKRRLAAMLACLQVEKSREVATLRGQLNSLTKVELNLIDDLTNRGVLKEEDVKTMIDTHIQSIEGQIGEMNGQKERQKGILVKRMEDKLRSHEEELVARHQQQAEEITEKSEKSPAYMYKKMLLLQKHKTERKQLRDNVRIESEQSVEELERKFELNRLKEIKKKELMFISKLVSLADFDKDELSDVFKAMFVTRSKDELDTLLENAKTLTEAEKEARGPVSILSKAKEELIKRQSSQRFQLSAKKQGLLKPKIRPRRSKDAAQLFPRSIRTVAQEAMVQRLNSRGSSPRAPSAT